MSRPDLGRHIWHVLTVPAQMKPPSRMIHLQGGNHLLRWFEETQLHPAPTSVPPRKLGESHPGKPTLPVPKLPCKPRRWGISKWLSLREVSVRCLASWFGWKEVVWIHWFGSGLPGNPWGLRDWKKKKKWISQFFYWADGSFGCSAEVYDEWKCLR